MKARSEALKTVASAAESMLLDLHNAAGPGGPLGKIAIDLSEVPSSSGILAEESASFNLLTNSFSSLIVDIQGLQTLQEAFVSVLQSKSGKPANLKGEEAYKEGKALANALSDFFQRQSELWRETVAEFDSNNFIATYSMAEEAAEEAVSPPVAQPNTSNGRRTSALETRKTSSSSVNDPSRKFSGSSTGEPVEDYKAALNKKKSISGPAEPSPEEQAALKSKMNGMAGKQVLPSIPTGTAPQLKSTKAPIINNCTVCECVDFQKSPFKNNCTNCFHLHVQPC